MSEGKIYLTVGKNPKGKGLLAIMSMGQPQLGDAECTILTVEIVKNQKQARKWFERMAQERPWEMRQ